MSLNNSALTLRGDPYESHDPVFGVKESLVIDLSEVSDPKMCERYEVKMGTKLLEHHFVLESSLEAENLRNERAKAVMEIDGQKISFFHGLPVPAVD